MTCPASKSGMCLQMTEGFTPCADECERDLFNKWADRQREQARPVRRAPRRPRRRLPKDGSASP